MESIETIRVFLGWCSAINMGLLVVTGVFLAVGSKGVARLHASMFAMDEAEVRKEYLQYLANFKALVLIFNLVPYIVLRIMA